MDTNFDYYFIGSTYPPNVPLLTVDDKIDAGSVDFLARSIIMPDNYVARVRFGAPVPAKPRLADYFSLDGGDAVFSKKIHDVLENHPVKGLQLVPAIIRGKKDVEYKDFWVGNVYQKMYSFDKEKSQFGYISSFTNSWHDIERFVLDEELLLKTPLEDRLVFVCKENVAYIMYHKSVVDIIMSVEPEGICFTSIDEWSDDAQFDD
jgi:hypothetical protein